MGESSLWSQAQGEGHKKQEKVMSRTFVKSHRLKQKLQPQLNTFGFKRVHFNRNYQFFLAQMLSLDVETMNDSARFYEFV